MDFSKVKSMTIPEGEVALLYIDGKTVWRKAVEQLATPTISIDGDILTITTTDERTEEFVIFVDGVETTTVENETATLITFTVDGTTYYAEEGMTWGEWVNSEYNTDNYFLDKQSIKIGDRIVELADGASVVNSDEIISGYNYILRDKSPF